MKNSKCMVASLALVCLQNGAAFAFTPIATPIHRSPAHPSIPSLRRSQLQMSNDNSQIEKLKEQAQRVKLEAEKLEAELNLMKINKLEAAIKASERLGDDAKAKSRNDIKAQIKALASRVDPSVLASLEQAVGGGVVDGGETNLAQALLDEMTGEDGSRVKTNTNLYKNRAVKDNITEGDLTAAVEYYTSLPKQMRKALAKSIDLDEKTAAPAVIVLGLYELGETLSESRLKKLYEAELSEIQVVQTREVSAMDAAAKAMVQEKREPDDPFNPFAMAPTSEDQINTMVENFLPRQTRKEGTMPTLAEAEVFTIQVLGTKGGKDMFQQSGKPEPISGGYLVRGKMAPKLKDDGDKLIAMLDAEMDSIAPAWNEKYQVSYMTDPTPKMLEDNDLNGAAVLVIHSRDMSPSASTLLNLSTTAFSIFFAFIFAIGTFATNEVVMDRLSAANGAADYDLTWFNQLITPFMISIGVIQASHEAAHWAVAKKEGFEITPPTVLPLMTLPYMSFQNRIKTSPKNLDTLFNFAFIGPAVGMVVSFAFLLIGLQMTLNMTPSELQYSAAVPVGFLQLSSLGGNIVDYVLGGGDGIILQQDPTTPVLLHPFAIGGFAGLMINALDTIPLAGTDGGRMSQALLGRPGHVAFSGVVFIALVGYTFFTGNKDIFLTYLFITSFTQQDLEIPARNEVDQAGLGKAAIALTMWSVAILALAPVN